MVHTDFTPAPLDYLAPAWQPGRDVACAAPPWNWQEYHEEIPTQTDLASGSSALSETSSQAQEIPFPRSTGSLQLHSAWPRALVFFNAFNA